MKNRANIFIFIGLTILFIPECYSQTDTFKLEDVWVVNSFKFAKISAMDEKTAQEWIGKKAIIKEQLYFEYQKVGSYKDIFTGEDYCNFRPNQTREVVLTDSYLSTYKMSRDNLGIQKKEILIIYTSCTGTPFNEIIVKSNDEIIIVWDGTFFILNRKK